MRKHILFLLFIGALLPQISKAQHLVAEEDLSYLYRYTSEELSSVEEPDSVYAFYEYGNNYEVGYVEDSTQITLDLLKCRNLQVLELHNIQATDVLAHLDQFPYLQILILDNIGLQSLPDGFYALKNLKKLELSNFESLHFDGSKMAENNIHELNLTNSISRNADEEMVDHPLEIFSQLKSLVMSGDGMNIPESLYSLTNLVYLDLSALGLTYISPQIENLVNLESLYLNNNDYLDNLPDEIGNLTSLRYLNLSGCNLEQLPAGIEKLIALESLDLSLNPIAELPEGIGNLEMLYSLNLSGTGMVNLPYSLKNCKSLNTLNMFGCGLEQIPLVLFECSGISDLDLGGNAITRLPAALSGMSGLTILDLSSNPLIEIEPGALNLPNVYSLFMPYCHLKSLPNDINKMVSLNYLDLSGDSLTSIPKSLYEITALQVLNLSYNVLKSLPDGISNLYNLYDLSVSYNQITTLPKDLTKLKSLIYLNINDNKIAKLPKGVSKMKALSYLDLRGNKNIKLSKELGSIEQLYEIKIREADLSPSALVKLQGWVGEGKVYIADY